MLMDDDECRLAKIVDNSRAVSEYLEGVTRERWDTDGILRDAVLSRMLLLDRIVSSLPEEQRGCYPEETWQPILGYWYRAVHRTRFSIHWAQVWSDANDVPPVLERQGLGIIRSKFPDLADRYGVSSEPDDHAEERETGRFSAFAKSHYADGLADGQKKAHAKAAARVILRVLKNRGISVDDDFRRRIEACTDQEMLDTWLDRVAGANRIEDLFAG